VSAPESSVVQGFLEGANVGPISGMNELITASRTFEAFQRVIQTFRTLDERTARDLAKG
jgi:flagellar basal-body rod protein FlgG